MGKKKHRLSGQNYDVGLRAFSSQAGYDDCSLRGTSERHLHQMKTRCEKTLAEWRMTLECAQKRKAMLYQNLKLDPDDRRLQTDLETCHRVIEKSGLHITIQELRLERIVSYLTRCEAVKEGLVKCG